jgi:hypothetical protein
MEPISRQERLLPCWQHPIPNAALRQPYGAGVVTTVVVPPVTKVLGTAPVPRMMFRKP